MDNAGYLAAFGAVAIWGSYGVPFKKSPSAEPVQFQMLMGIGIFLFALFVSPLLGYSLTPNIYGLAAGCIWAVANIVSLPAIRNAGMSRAMPVWVSCVVLSSFLWGVIVFHELPSGLFMGIIGIIGIIIGVLLVAGGKNAQGATVKKGLVFAIIAGILFGTAIVPLKLGNLSPSEFFFPMSLGIVVTALFYTFAKQRKFVFNKAVASFGILGGVLWNIGNLFSIIAIANLGLAKGYPITQAAVLTAVLWGLLYFKESTSKRDIIRIFIGAVTLVIGVIILGFA